MTAITAAPPAMSVFMFCIPALDLIVSPPVSYVTPFPMIVTRSVAPGGE